MDTYYTLIAEPGELSIQSHFYHVQVGSSRAAQRALLFLNGYCKSKTYYLAMRSREDDLFRLKIAESLEVKVYDLPCMVAKVEKLVAHIRKHGCLPFTPADSGHLRYLKAQTEPNYLLFCNTSCLKRGTK